MAGLKRFSHILVRHSYEAEDLLRKLQSGSRFEALAAKFSTCSSSTQQGDLGYLKSGQTVEEFEETAFLLKVGEISKPIRTKFGYHLIKRTE